MSLVKFLKGHISAHVAYPLAEYMEKRVIRKRLAEIKKYYQLVFAERRKISAEKLYKIVNFAGSQVPYYRDLFQTSGFNSENIRKDVRYLDELPYLTKDIIREQGNRLLSRPLEGLRHHACKTGGSTGLSCFIYYDQEAMDYSAAITLYARASIGKSQRLSELHFASRFPEVFPWRARLREHIKCFAMNRSNIFFAALDDKALEEIWRTLQKRRPYLVHAHPSTVYALACYVEKQYGCGKSFTVFESSGELFEHYMREKIAKVFSCKTVDRYGLAEFGVIAYESVPSMTNTAGWELQVLDSEGWVETLPAVANEPSEIVFTGFHNQLMPLLRYCTGDLGCLEETPNGFVLSNLVGRIHDVISIQGVNYATHYIQDILDRVGGIQEFQIDLRQTLPKLLLVAESWAKPEEICARLKTWWQEGLEICFVEHTDLIRVGHRAKFRHVVHP